MAITVMIGFMMSWGRLKEDDQYRYYYDHSGRLKLIRSKRTLQIVEAYRYDASGKRVSSYKKDGKIHYSQLGTGGEIIKQEEYKLEELDENSDPDTVRQYVSIGGTNVLTVTHSYNAESDEYEEEREYGICQQNR